MYAHIEKCLHLCQEQIFRYHRANIPLDIKYALTH